jgi:predicted Holliday junction resolvase-like endonuclease
MSNRYFLQKNKAVIIILVMALLLLVLVMWVYKKRIESIDRKIMPATAEAIPLKYWRTTDNNSTIALQSKTQHDEN